MLVENNKLTDIFKMRKCFKLVCGAGNEDAVEVEKLVTLYAKAGANYFDLSPRLDVVLAAKQAIQKSIPQEEQDQYFLNVSVGLSGDHHARKAVISQEKCINCGACVKVCPQSTIKVMDNKHFVVEKRCIGCGACSKVCPVGAISYFHKELNFKEVLPPLINLGLSSLELHASTSDEVLALSQWESLGSIYDGILSLCIDRSLLSDEKLVARIKNFIANRSPYSTIIQADGAPMSGGSDDLNTTLQAVATADIVQKANLPVWILLSGGTNSKTTQLAKSCGVKAHGVALGSFARKIVKPYIERADFLDNEEVFNQALIIAKDLVNNSLKYLQDD